MVIIRESNCAVVTKKFLLLKDKIDKQKITLKIIQMVYITLCLFYILCKHFI